MAQNEYGWILKGKVTDVHSQPTKKDKTKTMYTYFVLLGRVVQPVRSMINGLKAGDNFLSHCTVKPYVSNKGFPGIEVWENERLQAASK